MKPICRGTRSESDSKAWTCDRCKQVNEPFELHFFDVPKLACPCGKKCPHDFKFNLRAILVNGYSIVRYVKKQRGRRCTANAYAAAVEIKKCIKAVRKNKDPGLIPELDPNNLWLNVQEEFPLHKVCEMTTSQKVVHMGLMVKRKGVKALNGSKYYKVSDVSTIKHDDLQTMLNAIGNGEPLVAAIRSGKNLRHLKWCQIYKAPSSERHMEKNKKIKTHAVVLIGGGLQNGFLFFYFLNSWGKKFCVRRFLKPRRWYGIGKVRKGDLSRSVVMLASQDKAGTRSFRKERGTTPQLCRHNKRLVLGEAVALKKSYREEEHDDLNADLDNNDVVEVEEDEDWQEAAEEIKLHNSVFESEGTEGEEEAKKAYMAAREESDTTAEVAAEVDAMLQELEKAIDDVDAQIGNRWQLRDRDHDGKVTPEEVAATAAYHKDTIGKEGVNNLSKVKEGKVRVDNLEQEMTLEEYEKMQDKKSLEATKPEERKVAAVAFEGLTLLVKKKIEDDARLKVENGRKAKEVAAKEAKPRKAISIQEHLKPEDGSEYVPPTPPRRPQNGAYRGGRGNGAYNGRSSRDNSSERRVYNSGRGENSIVFHNVDANANTNDSGAPRRGEGYNGERRQGSYQQGGYNGGRGNGRYQERQDGYNGERLDQQGGYYQERRDAYNGDRREQGGYNDGGRGNVGYQERRYAYNGERREQGGYNGGRGNGGNQERQDAYNGDRREQGGYNGGVRANGGNQERQDGYNGGDRRQQGGYYNGGRGNGGYQQGGNYGQKQASKQEFEGTAADFPALGGASQAQSQSQA